jgi:hypothetical protein
MTKLEERGRTHSARFRNAGQDDQGGVFTRQNAPITVAEQGESPQ